MQLQPDSKETTHQHPNTSINPNRPISKWRGRPITPEITGFRLLSLKSRDEELEAKLFEVFRDIDPPVHT